VRKSPLTIRTILMKSSPSVPPFWQGSYQDMIKVRLSFSMMSHRCPLACKSLTKSSKAFWPRSSQAQSTSRKTKRLSSTTRLFHVKNKPLSRLTKTTRQTLLSECLKVREKKQQTPRRLQKSLFVALTRLLLANKRSSSPTTSMLMASSQSLW